MARARAARTAARVPQADTAKALGPPAALYALAAATARKLKVVHSPGWCFSPARAARGPISEATRATRPASFAQRGRRAAVRAPRAHPRADCAQQAVYPLLPGWASVIHAPPARTRTGRVPPSASRASPARTAHAARQRRCRVTAGATRAQQT
eukprot:3401584-Prymnesium_polylepis.1